MTQVARPRPLPVICTSDMRYLRAVPALGCGARKQSSPTAAHCLALVPGRRRAPPSYCTTARAGPAADPGPSTRLASAQCRPFMDLCSVPESPRRRVAEASPRVPSPRPSASSRICRLALWYAVRLRVQSLPASSILGPLALLVPIVHPAVDVHDRPTAHHVALVAQPLERRLDPHPPRG